MKHYKYWIALEQTKGIGPVHLREIYESLKKLNLSIVDLFDLTAGEIQAELSLHAATAETILQAKSRLMSVEDDYFNMLDANIGIIPFFEEAYPARLMVLLKNSFPPIIYSYGNKTILNERGAAILGEKNVSERGELISYHAAKELSRHRIAVISGMARGVGITAHRAALEHGSTTIAVLPSGLSHLRIPETLKEVFNPDTILIISPFYHTQEYSKFHALQRNRLICALSRAVYIIESPLEGGIFEAGKSAKSLGIPLYVTEYAKYPDSASGNPLLMSTYGAHPVRGRMVNNEMIPNLDRLIGDVKFGE